LLGVIVHAGVNDAVDLGVALHIEGYLWGIAAMLAHAKRKCFQSLDKLEGVSQRARAHLLAALISEFLWSENAYGWAEPHGSLRQKLRRHPHF
jgi:hypothetical protein